MIGKRIFVCIFSECIGHGSPQDKSGPSGPGVGYFFSKVTGLNTNHAHRIKRFSPALE